MNCTCILDLSITAVLKFSSSCVSKIIIRKKSKEKTLYFTNGIYLFLNVFIRSLRIYRLLCSVKLLVIASYREAIKESMGCLSCAPTTCIARPCNVLGFQQRLRFLLISLHHCLLLFFLQFQNLMDEVS